MIELINMCARTRGNAPGAGEQFSEFGAPSDGGICARPSDKGGPTPNFVSALRGQAEALPTAYVSELDDRTTRLGRATSYNMHGDGWSTCRRTPMEGEPMHGLDVESIFRGTGITSTTCVHDTRVVRTHANGLMGSG